MRNASTDGNSGCTYPTQNRYRTPCTTADEQQRYREDDTHEHCQAQERGVRTGRGSVRAVDDRRREPRQSNRGAEQTQRPQGRLDPGEPLGGMAHDGDDHGRDDDGRDCDHCLDDEPDHGPLEQLAVPGRRGRCRRARPPRPATRSRARTAKPASSRRAGQVETSRSGRDEQVRSTTGTHPPSDRAPDPPQRLDVALHELSAEVARRPSPTSSHRHPLPLLVAGQHPGRGATALARRPSTTPQLTRPTRWSWASGIPASRPRRRPGPRELATPRRAPSAQWCR
jgi:hypothetical protein